MIGIFIRRGEDTHRRKPCEDGGRDWSGAAISQGMPRAFFNFFQQCSVIFIVQILHFLG